MSKVKPTTRVKVRIADGNKSAKQKQLLNFRNAQVTVEDRTLRSKALGREVKFRVVLPAGYQEGSRRYPVLYLLHGVFGGFENWDTLTDLRRYAVAVDLVIVTPDGANSWYVNSAAEPSQRYEDLVVQELVPEVDRQVRTIQSSHRRAIAGLSMGGYGSIKFALKYPDLFSFAGSISGAFNGPNELDERREDLRDDLRRAFGEAGSRTRRENDIFKLLAEADSKMLPYFYMDCGTADEFCEVNRKFAAELCKKQARYEYHEVGGEHSWKYWDRRIRELLPIVEEKLTAD